MIFFTSLQILWMRGRETGCLEPEYDLPNGIFESAFLAGFFIFLLFKLLTEGRGCPSLNWQTEVLCLSGSTLPWKLKGLHHNDFQ